MGYIAFFELVSRLRTCWCALRSLMRLGRGSILHMFSSQNAFICSSRWFRSVVVDGGLIVEGSVPKVQSIIYAC